MSKPLDKPLDKSVSNNVSAAIRNKAIDDYFKITLQGHIAAGVGNKEAITVVREAMDYAIAAYYYRCELLGVTFCKATDL